VPQGVVAIGVVLMVLGAFWAVECFGAGGAFRREAPAPVPQRPALL